MSTSDIEILYSLVQKVLFTLLSRCVIHLRAEQLESITGSSALLAISCTACVTVINKHDAPASQHRLHCCGVSFPLTSRFRKPEQRSISPRTEASRISSLTWHYLTGRLLSRCLSSSNIHDIWLPIHNPSVEDVLTCFNCNICKTFIESLYIIFRGNPSMACLYWNLFRRRCNTVFSLNEIEVKSKRIKRSEWPCRLIIIKVVSIQILVFKIWGKLLKLFS